MTATRGGDAPDPQPSDQPRFRDIVDALRGQDDRWEIQPSPGNLAMERVWSIGVVDQIGVYDSRTAYASREDVHQQVLWEKRGTPQEVLEAVQALDDPSTLDAAADPESSPRGDWR